MNEDTEICPRDSFKLLYSVLWWVGFYKPIQEPINAVKRYSHYVYRVIACLIVICFNLQHLIFIVQFNQDSGPRIEAIMMEITVINLLLKFINLNLRSSRVDALYALLDDPVLAAKNFKEKEYLEQNKKEVVRLARLLQLYVTVGIIIWPISLCLRRINDPNTVVPFYVPFKPDSWTKFNLHVFMLFWPLYWVGYGHITLDCLIVTYYAQAAVQLKIIKYNLEHLFQSKDDRRKLNSDADVTKRFYDCVKRFDKVNWLTHEVTDVFNPCLTFQFFTSSAAMCMVIYKISVSNIASIEFIVFGVLELILVTEIFMYCYYGNIVSYESEYINTALYLSDWPTAPPRVRKLFLIAMLRWTRPLTIRAAGLVPVCLNSFVSIVKSSYTLYTILVSKNNMESETARNK